MNNQAMRAVVDAAVEWRDAYDGLDAGVDDDAGDAGDAGDAFGRHLTRFLAASLGLKQVVDTAAESVGVRPSPGGARDANAR